MQGKVSSLFAKPADVDCIRMIQFRCANTKIKAMLINQHPQCQFASVFETPGSGSSADVVMPSGDSLLSHVGFVRREGWVCPCRIAGRSHRAHLLPEENYEGQRTSGVDHHGQAV
jgi:hypothetical protein